MSKPRQSLCIAPKKLIRNLLRLCREGGGHTIPKGKAVRRAYSGFEPLGTLFWGNFNLTTLYKGGFLLYDVFTTKLQAVSNLAPKERVFLYLK